MAPERIPESAPSTKVTLDALRRLQLEDEQSSEFGFSTVSNAGADVAEDDLGDPEVEVEAPVVTYTEEDIPGIIAALQRPSAKLTGEGGKDGGDGDRDTEEGELSKALASLTSISQHQASFALKHLTPHLPTFVQILTLSSTSAIWDQFRRQELIDVLVSLCTSEEPTAHAPRLILSENNNLEALVKLLQQSETLDKSSLLSLLEALFDPSPNVDEDDDASTSPPTRPSEGDQLLLAKLTPLFRLHLYSSPADIDANTGEYTADSRSSLYASAIETLESILIYSHVHLRLASLQSFALSSFLVPLSLGSSGTPVATRLAALACVTDAYIRLVEDEEVPLSAFFPPTSTTGVDASIPSVFTDLTEEYDEILQLEREEGGLDPTLLRSLKQTLLQTLILQPLLPILSEPEPAVSDAFVDFLYGYHEDEGVWTLVAQSEDVAKDLIRKIASKSTGEGGESQGPTEHTQTEWLLHLLLTKSSPSSTGPSSKEVVLTAFANFWQQEDEGGKFRVNLVRVLPGLLTSLSGAATQSGMSAFLSGHLEAKERDENETLDALTAVSALLKTEPQLKEHLIPLCKALGNVAQSPSSSDRSRVLADELMALLSVGGP